MTRPEGSKTRILIGASSFADATAALNILRVLKPNTPLMFGGLLVEESATIALCQLPNQRIVSCGGALVLAPSPSQVRTVLDADARAFRTSLEQISKSIAAQWSFERSIGELVQSALHASAGWDIIVFGHRNIHPVGGKIVLLDASSANGQTLADFADYLADAVSAERVVFTVGPGSANGRGNRHFDTMEAALAELARMNVQAVLVDLAHGPIHTPDDLRHLLDLARCPVFAFGAGLHGAELEHGTQIPPAPDTSK